MLKKGLLKRVGHRTEVVSGAMAGQFGLQSGPSLVKQIRQRKELERQQAERAKLRDERRERRKARAAKRGAP